MADDTDKPLTVEAARHALEQAIIDNTAFVRCDGSYPTLVPTARIDALIAAVRAENTPTTITCINCGHRMEAFYRDGKPVG